MECKRCDNGSHGWYGFFALAKKNNISPHLEHSAVLHLTLHTISNRQICQREICMINRLLYNNFHIIPHINPRHPYQPEGPRASGWYGCLGLIWGMIWKLLYNNLYLYNPWLQGELWECLVTIQNYVVVVLRFYGPVNPMGSCPARSVYLTTRLLGRLSPPSG